MPRIAPDIPVLITRAEPAASRTARRVSDMGFQPVVAPLFEVMSVPFDRQALRAASHLAFTSEAGVRALAACQDVYAGQPVFAVGERTHAAALEAGFRVLATGDGNVTQLAQAIAGALVATPRARVCHVSGERVAGDLVVDLSLRGMDAERVVIYRTVEASLLPGTALAALAGRRDVAALVYSPRGAVLLSRALKAWPPDGAAVPARKRLIALSQAVADHFSGAGWRIIVADQPNENALMDCLSRTCRQRVSRSRGAGTTRQAT